jgi:prepilin-type N-terminal cleavage/methylation domain-containing protein
MTGLRAGSRSRVRADAIHSRFRLNGFTMFEMVVAIIVLCVLATVLYGRLAFYQEYAEKKSMEVTIHNLRVGLRYQLADRMNRDQMQEVESLLTENPVTWLENPPSNYLGILNNPLIEEITPGNWYFDAAQHLLVYMPKHKRYLRMATPADTTLRFRVTAIKNPPKVVKGSGPPVELVSLTLLNEYKWDWPE